MAILPTPIVDYTDLDFDSLRARLYSLIGAAFPDWSEQEVASFGNLLVELMAHVGDVLGFYLDARARESRVTLATQRASVVALAKLLGYAPEGATAAQADVVFGLARVAEYPVPIPAGTPVHTLAANDQTEFQLLEAVTIAAGALTVTGTVEHSKTHVDVFASTARPNQEVQLRHSPFLDRAIYDGEVRAGEWVTADNGTYSRVDNFLQSTAGDRHYTIVVDENDRARLRFGNGIAGQIPTGTLQIQYKTGGGTAGNVDAGMLRKLTGAFTDTAGHAVQVSVTNPTRAAGGQPRKSRAQIQLEAPARLRVLKRTVAREDYEINARRVPGVVRALMLTSNEVPSVGENRGQLYILPAGGGKPSSALKQAVHQMCSVTYPNTITFKFEVLDPAYLTVNLYATIYPVRGVSTQGLKVLDAAIRVALYDYFALTVDAGTENERDNPNVNFGFYAAQTSSGAFDGQVALSDLVNVVRDVRGVRKIGDGLNDFLVNSQHKDLKIQAHQFPRLGTVTLINGETRTPLV